MITTQQAREIANDFIARLQRQDIEALMGMCTDKIVWSGLLVKKVTGEASGILQGKDVVRSFAEKLLRSGGGFSPTLNRIGVGVGSIVLDVLFEGVIGGFVVLVIDSHGKIAQVAVHQEAR